MRKTEFLVGIVGVLSVGVMGACTIKTDNAGGTGGKAEENRGGASSNSGGSGGTTGGSKASGGSSPGSGGADTSLAGADSSDAGEGTSGGRTSGGSTSTGGKGSGEAGSGGSGETTTFLDCEARDFKSATVVERVLSGQITWSGTVYLKDAVEVREDAVLTIEPGTNVIMGADASLEIGWNNGGATLKALGTEDKPIRFCGAQGEAGFWRGITVQRNVTSNSQLYHVLISDAGAAPEALNLVADIDVQHVQVRNAQKGGVRALDFRAGSTDLSVDGVAGTPIILAHSDAVDRFPVGGSFTNNGNNVALIDFTRVDADVTFHDLGIPYQQDIPNLEIRAVKMVVEPGVRYLFGPDSGMEIGWNSSAATLTAVGTSADPIVFDGVMAESGFWAGIKIQRNVTTNSVLSNVEIRHSGGNSAYALELNAPITLDEVLLTDNEAGAFIGAQGLDKDSKNVTVTKGEQRPLTVAPNALVSLPLGGSFTGNEVDEVAIEGGVFEQSGTVPNLGLPFRLLEGFQSRKSSLTLSAGSEFILPADSAFEIGWNGSDATFVAVGTAAKPIRFRGDTPSAGYWAGLVFGSKVLSDSKVDYVEVSHGKAACATLNSSVAITHSTFSKCEGYGILKKSADTRDYAATNTFTDVGSGGVGNL